MNIASIKDAALEMATIAPGDLPMLDWPWSSGQGPSEAWAQWARQVSQWLASQGVVVADAVVLLPQIALLNVARRAWARSVGGWPPRFETVGTLLDRLPPVVADSGVEPTLTLDPCVDQLLVVARLKSDSSGRAWARRDPDGFEFAVARMLEVAHQWIKAAMSQTPEGRAAMLAAIDDWMQEELTPWSGGDGPDPRARERVLTAMAMGWAAEALPALLARREALFDHVPSAWVALTPGPTLVPGTESRLMVSVLTHAHAQGLPVLWSRATLGALPLPELTEVTRPGLIPCMDGEDEAQQTAAQVLDLIERERQSGQGSASGEGREGNAVALIATDRVVTRRVRAILAPYEAQGLLTVSDESGWTLSTTRAASVVTRLLAAAQPKATTDDVLDWLSSGWVTSPGGAQALAELEALWRVRGALSPWAPIGRDDEAPTCPQVLQAWAMATLAPLSEWASQRRGTLSECLGCLAEVLTVSGAAASLAADAAGQAVLAALRLPAVDGQAVAEPDPMWLKVAASTRMRLRDLARWVDQTLEGATFMPAPGGEQADLIITPLTRAVLRPFAAVLLPGADEAQLGARGGDGWLSPVHAVRLGLSTQAVQQQGQWEAFAVLATHPCVIALSRHVRDGEPVAPSAWLTRWSLAAGWPLGQDLWPEPASCLEHQDIRLHLEAPPQPGLSPRGNGAEPADALWPARVSASSYERLRQCPYRFFALSLLGLKPLDELEEGLERQDHGTWLHAVLKRFHDDRPAELAPDDPAQDLVRWMAVAQEVAREHGLMAAGQSAYFLPYQATLERLGTHYIQWLRQHEAQGWRVVDMEATRELELALQEGAPKLKLHGQLDRIDRLIQFEGGQRRVMDYKTGSMSGLKAKLAVPLEDTQLAFYALLSGDDEQAPDVQASYLHIDDRACTDLPHPDVMTSAQALHDGVIDDFQRIWQGQGMPPLGEGAVCEYCEARGLCRKDHWVPGGQA